LTIHAVIFDVGGVLIRTEDPAPRRALEERLGLAPGEAEYLVFNGPMGLCAQRGEISADALWAWLQKELHLDDSGLIAFRQAFFAGDRLDTGLVEWIGRLRPTYQTAIISNAMDDLLEVITHRYPLVDAFDLVIGSAYERVMKPDPVIFQHALTRLGRTPGEALFIDDSPRNIAGAQAVGMAGVLYTPGMELVGVLARLGVSD
jgi:FMN phosphatase YigB (HAD superfamily)